MSVAVAEHALLPALRGPPPARLPRRRVLVPHPGRTARRACPGCTSPSSSPPRPGPDRVTPAGTSRPRATFRRKLLLAWITHAGYFPTVGSADPGGRDLTCGRAPRGCSRRAHSRVFQQALIALSLSVILLWPGAGPRLRRRFQRPAGLPGCPASRRAAESGRSGHSRAVHEWDSEACRLGALLARRDGGRLPG